MYGAAFSLTVPRSVPAEFSYGQCLSRFQSPAVHSPAVSPSAQVISPPQRQPQSLPSTPRMSLSTQGSLPKPHNTRVGSISTTSSTSSSLRTSVLTSSTDFNAILSTQPKVSQTISSSPSSFMTPMQPMATSIPSTTTSTASAPNYNISLPLAQPLQPRAPQLPPSLTPQPSSFVPPGMNTLLTPSQPAKPQWPSGNTTTKTLSKADWGDFDPLA